MPRMVTTVLTLAALAAMASCNVGGVLIDGLSGGPRQVDVKADYYGLNDKSVAVLLAADEYLLGRRHHGVDIELATEVTRAIQQHIPGVRTVDPRQMQRFQTHNPLWTAVPYDQLIERLDVDRLVVIELLHYSTHEPGNIHQFHGNITANVGVAERESPDGDMALSKRVEVRFPESAKFGLIDMDEPTIRLGLHKLFTMRVTGIFHDHKVTVE